MVFKNELENTMNFIWKWVHKLLHARTISLDRKQNSDQNYPKKSASESVTLLTVTVFSVCTITVSSWWLQLSHRDLTNSATSENQAKSLLGISSPRGTDWCLGSHLKHGCPKQIAHGLTQLHSAKQLVVLNGFFPSAKKDTLYWLTMIVCVKLCMALVFTVIVSLNDKDTFWEMCH